MSSETSQRSKDVYLQSIRRAELDEIREHFIPGSQVLELGGKTGFQAAILASWGCKITSLDIDIPAATSKTYWPVRLFDGVHISAEDASFDMIYSSHMLYWVLHKPEFFVEMRRVLKPGGLGIHVMPTVAWRTLTSLTYYPFCLLRAGFVLRRKFSARTREGASATEQAAPAGRRDGLLRRACRLTVCPPLGPAPSAFHEWRQWRRSRMVSLFAAQGFETLTVIPLHLFYSGHFLFGARLSFSARRRLSMLLGSASCVFVIRRLV